MTKTMLRVHQRWMLRSDLPAFLAIERASFDPPWDEADYLATLRVRNQIGMVAESGREVVGLMLYILHRDRIHVIKFAVKPDARRSGVGSQMVAKLVGKLGEHGRTHLTLNIRESNLDGQRFWASRGFKAEAIARGYYGSTGEDAYRFAYRLADQESSR